MNFISTENLYVLDCVSTPDELITLWLEFDENVAFKFKGSFRFFNDSNGVGDSWVDYEHNIQLEFVPMLSDTPRTNYNEDWIVELLANNAFKQYANQEF